MKFDFINKELLAGIATAVVLSLVVTTVPWNMGSVATDEMTSEFHIQNSAGANSSILADDSVAAGATGAVNGETVGIVDLGGNLVGNPSQEEPEKPVYETFGYTNLGMSKVEGNLNVRKGPSTDTKVVGKLTNHNACEILGEENGWYKITSGNVTGYVSADYMATGEEALIIAQTEARDVATVITDSLRVREKPSTDSRKLTNIAKDEKVTVVEILDGWVKVEINGYDEAYIALEYVSIAKELPTGNTMEELQYGQGVSALRVDLVNFALQFVGNRYVWGGNSLTHGVDCSGFTQQVFKQYGYYIPRTSRTQPSAGTQISAAAAKPGDLFFYGDSNGINHVAIYIGNGRIVHAANSRAGIIISNAFYSTPICVVSYLD